MELQTMTDELEALNKKSLKGTFTIESAKAVAEIPPNNTREHLFKVVKDLFAFSKKALDLVKTSNMKSTEQDNQTLENIIKKQLKDVLPDLLKDTLSSLPSVQMIPDAVREEKPLPDMHTLTVENKPEEEEGETKPISETDWATVVRRDIKGSLKSIPVQKASLSSGAATLRFSSKNDLDKAKDALTKKYKVSPKSEEQKKLDPKLTISDLDPEITTVDQLMEELLDENEYIKELNGMEKMKVIFLDKSDHFAVLRVSADIREAIRQKEDRVHLGLQSHRVRDRIHVVQCYHCQEFGHTSVSKYCKSKDSDSTCFYCAGSHASRDCQHKKTRKINKVKCSNCTKSRSYAERNAATTHKASDTLCPFYVRETERMMSRTMGCTEQTKNLYRQRVQELRTKLGRR